MDPAFLTYVMMAAIGFAAGGVLMSGFFLVTGKPLGFARSELRCCSCTAVHRLARCLKKNSSLLTVATTVLSC